MYYIESVPIERVQYILSLPDDVILCEMYDADELTNTGGKWNTTTYIRQIKDYCKRLKLGKGTVKQTYKFSNRLKDVGRQFVNGFGIQSLQHKLRGFFCEDNYADFDMINAHPTILKYLVELYFPSYEFPELNKYIANRDKLLKTFQADKRDILIALNSDKQIITQNKLVKRLDREFKAIQDLFWNSTEYEEFKGKGTKSNVKGSFLNTILCVEENNILQNVLNEFKVAVPMFDGFLIHMDHIPDNIIEKLNDITAEYGVKWAEKAHDSTIQIDEDLLEDMEDLQDYKDYETLKIEFEEKYFVLRNPTCFCEEKDNEIIMRNRADFSTITEGDIYYDENHKGEYKEKNFFKSWLKDRSRREFDKIDYIPTYKKIPDGIYNTFRGFDFKGTQCYNQELVEIYLNHLKLLVNWELDSYKYLVGYIAHLFQKPDSLPETALLFKSQQGVGKDAMIDFIQKIMGESTCFRTQNIDSVFSKFNGELKNRLLLQLDEMMGQDGFAKKEALKNLITTKSLNINEKNLKPYTISNYIRVIIFSNNLTPIDIPHDDRRYCVFKCGAVQPKDYYSKLYGAYHNTEAIESIAHYFMNYDLSQFDLKDRPLTSAYKEMQQANLHPLYEYLYDSFVIENPADEFGDELHIHKKTSDILITPRGIQGNFHYYLETIQQTYIKHDYKILKLLLSDMEIYSKDYRVKSQPPTKYYRFPQDSARLLELLRKKGFEPPEIEEA